MPSFEQRTGLQTPESKRDDRTRPQGPESQQRQQEREAREAETEPVPPPKPKLPEAYVKEKNRRREIQEILTEANELDEELKKHFLTTSETGSLTASIDKIEAIETLSSGEEVVESRKNAAGQENVSVTTRREYAGDPPRIAYAKPQSGEPLYGHDDQTGKSFKILRVFKNGKMYERREFLKKTGDTEEENEEFAFRNAKKYLPVYKRNIAEAYGIDPSEVPLNEDQFAAHFGIEAGKSTLREYIVSRINEVLGMDVVPLTVLRKEQNGADYASVQEAVRGSDPEQPPRPLADEDIERIVKKIQSGDTSSPEVRSLVRIATLDRLVKSTDRHRGNFMIDPVSGEIKGIDNGLSLGLSSQTEEGVKPLRPLRSFPMEILNKFPDLKVDDAQIAHLKSFYGDTKEYLAYKESLGKGSFMEEKAKEAEMQIKGEKFRYISKLFRLLHGNEKIAQAEAKEFFRNIAYVIDHGRPEISEGLLIDEHGEMIDEMKKQAA